MSREVILKKNTFVQQQKTCVLKKETSLPVKLFRLSPLSSSHAPPPLYIRTGIFWVFKSWFLERKDVFFVGFLKKRWEKKKEGQING